MKKEFRIKDNQRFGEIVHLGKTFKNKAFVIHCLKNNENVVKIGISVSKKLGKAIVRNKIKRRIRAMCQEIVDFNSQSLDIIIIAKNNYLENDFHTNLCLLEQIINLAINLHGEAKNNE